MPTFETQRQDFDERALIRKVQKAIAVLAPTTVELPASLFAAGGGLVDLKALGFLPIGIVTPDGYSFGRDVSKTEVSAFGYAGPVRSDVESVARTISMTPLESGRKHMLELAYGTDLSAVQQTLANGEIVFDEPDLPADKEYRLLIIGSDGPADENWILGRGYPSVKLASTDEQTWGTSDPVSQPLTFDVFTDPETGTPVKHYLGGTGATKHKEALGFAQASA